MDITYSRLTATLTVQLRSLHYCDSTIQKYEREWRRFENYLNDENLSEFTNKIVEDYFKKRFNVDFNAPAKDHTRGMRQTMRALRTLIDFRDHNIIYRRVSAKDHSIPYGFQETVKTFLHQIENTMSDTTYRQYRSHIESFVAFLDSQEKTSFTDLTPEIIKVYWGTRSYLKNTSREYDAYVLRKLFDYLYENGICSIDFSVFVPNIKGNHKGSIPSFYTPEELTKVLAAVDRSGPIGKRDYAILLLAIRYGMRVGDIRKLKLSDFDWINSKFSFVQSKTGKHQEFALLSDVSTAIIDYFKNGRPKTDCNAVFVRHNAPYTEFGKENNLHNIISKYMNMAGITDFHRRKHGLHSLRHSVAGNMLNQGIPMPTISEVLGHSSTETTMIYMKIDIEQLSSCALEVK